MVSFVGFRPGRTGLPACCAHDFHHAHNLEWQTITVQGKARCAVYLAALVADYLAPRVERAVVVLLLATSLQEGRTRSHECGPSKRYRRNTSEQRLTHHDELSDAQNLLLGCEKVSLHRSLCDNVKRCCAICNTPAGWLAGCDDAPAS